MIKIVVNNEVVRISNQNNMLIHCSICNRHNIFYPSTSAILLYVKRTNYNTINY